MVGRDNFAGPRLQNDPALLTGNIGLGSARSGAFRAIVARAAYAIDEGGH
jgi:hypothetical protein